MKSNLKCSDLPTMMIVCAMFGIMQKWRIYFEILKTFFILQNDELKLPRMKKRTVQNESHLENKSKSIKNTKN
jgi:hypothetical protein